PNLQLKRDSPQNDTLNHRKACLNELNDVSRTNVSRALLRKRWSQGYRHQWAMHALRQFRTSGKNLSWRALPTLAPRKQGPTMYCYRRSLRKESRRPLFRQLWSSLLLLVAGTHDWTRMGLSSTQSYRRRCRERECPYSP